MRYIYLDTSAIVNLGKFKTENPWNKIDNLLRNGKYTLLLSTTHMYEFSKGRKEKDYTAIYLDTLPYIKWVIPPWYIWKEEVKNALNYCINSTKYQFPVFYDLFFTMYTTVNKKHKKLKYYIGQPTTAGQTIDFFKKGEIYKETEEVAEHCTKMVRKIREKALIWQSWKIALRMQIRDFWPTETAADLRITRNDSFLDEMMKVSDFCMPSLFFITQLRRIKWSNKEPIEPNDFIDEFHASYAPYCDAIMHDKATCRRATQTNSEFARKFTNKPEELVKIIEDIDKDI